MTICTKESCQGCCHEKNLKNSPYNRPGVHFYTKKCYLINKDKL